MRARATRVPILHQLIESHRRGRQRSMVFEQIYDQNLWVGTESRSGPGSDLSRTEAIRRELPEIVRNLGIRSLLDVPCGDFFWMRRVELDLDYTGVDIVPAIVDANVRQYASATRRFRRLDMVTGPLPRADLVLSRDGLVHLSYEDALRVIANIVRSRSKFLLATTFVATAENEDTNTGGWRPLNLCVAPFWFPAPLHVVHERLDRDTYRDKALGLWRVNDLS
jgi:SAM-dependent methyltransferase